MKKTVLNILVLIFMTSASFAQNVNIPDANFKAYLVGNTNINTNNDGEIQNSEAAAFTGTIDCTGLSIADMTGIEAFTMITELRCSGNDFGTLDLSSNTALLKLFCTQSPNLVSLDISQNVNLTDLYLYSSTSLNTLDVSNNIALINLDVQDNYMSTFDVSNNTNLESLNIGFNYLSTIDLSQNTALKNFYCFQNHSITTLDLSNNPNLTTINCSNMTDLTSLNLKNISTSATLYADNNPNLTCIEVDDVADATSNWTTIDATANFSLDCGFSSSINPSELSQYINIYPNPVVSKIHINSYFTIESVSIINVFGKNVELNLTSTTSIDLSGLPNGVYFIKVHTNKGLISKKFIKY